MPITPETRTTDRRADVVVAGQLARDLVLGIGELPPAGGGTTVERRREMLGGKGANCAVGAAQLGARVALLAVADVDAAAPRLRAAATVVLQAQQPGPALLAAARHASTRAPTHLPRPAREAGEEGRRRLIPPDRGDPGRAGTRPGCRRVPAAAGGRARSTIVGAWPAPAAGTLTAAAGPCFRPC